MSEMGEGVGVGGGREREARVSELGWGGVGVEGRRWHAGD